MTKEELLALGFTETQITSILKLHKETIDGNFIPKHRFDEVNGELKTAKGQVTERDKQLGELKKFEGDKVALEAKVKELEEANTTSDKTYKETLAKERKTNAVKLAMAMDESKPHDPTLVMGMINLDTIQLDENGNITSGLKEQQETLKKDKAFLFKTVETKEPEKKGWEVHGKKPEEGNLGGGGKSDPTVSYGQSLAQIKLGMMGVTPKTGTESK